MSQLGGFDRLLDFKNRAADSGLYLDNGSLRFYPSSATGSKVVANNEWAQVVITRATDGTMRGFVDGVQQWQFADNGGLGALSSNRLVLFADNVSGAAPESSRPAPWPGSASSSDPSPRRRSAGSDRRRAPPVRSRLRQ